MKYSLAKDQRDFFEKHGFIEFAEFLSPAQLNTLYLESERVLLSRLNTKNTNLTALSPIDIFRAGHDLFRDSDAIKRCISQQRFAGLAFDLLNIRPLRLAFDQFLISSNAHSSLEKNTDAFSHLLNSTIALADIVSVQGFLAAFILCIEANDTVETDAAPSMFPGVAGNATIVSPNALLDFKLLKKQKNARYLIVGIASSHAVYIHRNSDPHTHYLKNTLGYVFGDKLSDKHHPVIYR